MWHLSRTLVQLQKQYLDYCTLLYMSGYFSFQIWRSDLEVAQTFCTLPFAPCHLAKISQLEAFRSTVKTHLAEWNIFNKPCFFRFLHSTTPSNPVCTIFVSSKVVPLPEASNALSLSHVSNLQCVESSHMTCCVHPFGF